MNVQMIRWLNKVLMVNSTVSVSSPNDHLRVFRGSRRNCTDCIKSMMLSRLGACVSWSSAPVYVRKTYL
eukprot:366400-Pyramimonas_sp.AAC.2